MQFVIKRPRPYKYALHPTECDLLCIIINCMNPVFFSTAVNVGDEGGFAPNIQDNREGEVLWLFMIKEFLITLWPGMLVCQNFETFISYIRKCIWKLLLQDVYYVRHWLHSFWQVLSCWKLPLQKQVILIKSKLAWMLLPQVWFHFFQALILLLIYCGGSIL